jgi:hypothetical protein
MGAIRDGVFDRAFSTLRGYVSGGKAPAPVETDEAARIRRNLNAAHQAMQDALNAGDKDHADMLQRAISAMENTLLRLAREAREEKAGFDAGWSYR